MIIIISSKIGQSDIAASLGKPEYSYYFLMKEFVPALEKIGTVVEAVSFEDIDSLYTCYQLQNEQVIFLSFTPPHQTPMHLKCPTFCVFAWEFNRIPDNHADQSNSWHHVLSHLRGAIALSQEAAEAVRISMGANYPVISLPAPLWDKYAAHNEQPEFNLDLGLRVLEFQGEVIDSPTLGLSADGLAGKPLVSLRPQIQPLKKTFLTRLNDKWGTTKKLAVGWWNEVAPHFFSPALRAESPSTKAEYHTQHYTAHTAKKQLLKISGVVYTSIINPEDGRKNWIDLISAFCWAFKNTRDATLVVKMIHSNPEVYKTKVMTHLSRLSPFKCRVIVINCFLESSEYQKLINISTFYVNTSACEGYCLPLVEHLCKGKPGISPIHTAMRDYLNSDNAIPIQSSAEPASFLHDNASRLITRRYRLNWESLVEAYLSSHEIAIHNPQRYKEMSVEASRRMLNFCSVDRVANQLHSFLNGAEITKTKSDINTPNENTDLFGNHGRNNQTKLGTTRI